MEYTIEQLEKDGWNPTATMSKIPNSTSTDFSKDSLGSESYGEFKLSSDFPQLHQKKFWVSKDERDSSTRYKIFFQIPKINVSEDGLAFYSNAVSRKQLNHIVVPIEYIGYFIDTKISLLNCSIHGVEEKSGISVFDICLMYNLCFEAPATYWKETDDYTLTLLHINNQKNFIRKCI